VGSFSVITVGHFSLVIITKPQLLILDEFGMRNLPKNTAEDLLELFHRRYHAGANMIATNRPIEDWGKILGDTAATSAILDRFLHNIHLIKITGKSHRLKALTKGTANLPAASRQEKS
jgi:DNA replication protein DnaC